MVLRIGVAAIVKHFGVPEDPRVDRANRHELMEIHLTDDGEVTEPGYTRLRYLPLTTLWRGKSPSTPLAPSSSA